MIEADKVSSAVDVSSQSALAQLGMSGEQVDAELMELERELRSREVCICGHAIRRHSLYEATWDCHTGRIWCPCSEPIAVLEAEDLRMFQCQTYGWGAKHALAQGIIKSDKAKRRTRLLANGYCWVCRRTGNLRPTPIDQNNSPTKLPSAKNALLCEKCFLGLQGVSAEVARG